MNCEEVRQFLSPYLDSELDDKTIFVISRHLEDCPDCALRFRQEEQLEEQISQRLRRATGDERAVFEAAVRKAIASRPPLLSRRTALVGALALVSIVILFAVLNSYPEIPDLLAAAASDHQKYVEGKLAPHVSGEQSEDLKGFLRERVGVEVHRLPSDGVWTVRGARLCHLRSAKVGLLMLRSDETLVSIYIVPASEADKFPEARLIASKSPSCFPVPGGHGFLRLEKDGTMRCAIGRLEPENLEGLLASTR
jgi:anti-sigma factor RsiW